MLFTAAVVSEQKQDVASARVYFDQGTKLDPKARRFCFGLPNGNAPRPPDRAEAVLRRGFEATQTINTAFSLADTLIQQGKIEGKDQRESI